MVWFYRDYHPVDGIGWWESVRISKFQAWWSGCRLFFLHDFLYFLFFYGTAEQKKKKSLAGVYSPWPNFLMGYGSSHTILPHLRYPLTPSSQNKQLSIGKYNNPISPYQAKNKQTNDWLNEGPLNMEPNNMKKMRRQMRTFLFVFSLIDASPTPVYPWASTNEPTSCTTQISSRLLN